MVTQSSLGITAMRRPLLLLVFIASTLTITPAHGAQLLRHIKTTCTQAIKRHPYLALGAAVAAAVMAWNKLTEDTNGIGHYSLINQKRGDKPNQDRIIRTIQPDHAFFALLDGHGDSNYPVDYAHQHLYNNVVTQPTFAHNPQQALVDGIKQTANNLNKSQAQKSSTTVVAAVIKDGNLSTAWAGDSRAIVCRAGQPHPLTQDHSNGGNHQEFARIKALAASKDIPIKDVQLIAVTRALGDFECHPYLISDPESTHTPLQDNDEFLILESDGVHDVLDDVQAVHVVRENAEHNAYTAAFNLCHRARKRGSRDDITALVINLKKLPAALTKPKVALSPQRNLDVLENAHERPSAAPMGASVYAKATPDKGAQ